MTSLFFLDWNEPSSACTQLSGRVCTKVATVELSARQDAPLSTQLARYREVVNNSSDPLLNGPHAADSKLQGTLTHIVQNWFGAAQGRELFLCSNRQGFTALNLRVPSEEAEVQIARNIAHIMIDLVRSLVETALSSTIEFELAGPRSDWQDAPHKAFDGGGAEFVKVQMAGIQPVEVDPPASAEDGMSVVEAMLGPAFLERNESGQSPLGRLAARYSRAIDNAVRMQQS